MSDDHDDTRLVASRAAAAATQRGGPDGADTVILTGHVVSVSRDAPAPALATHPVPRLDAGLYSYRIGDQAEPITLDVPSYIGRKPTSPRVTTRVAPRLVRVASPLKEVSATHLEVRQLGASVIVTDLRTTNGSVVMLPGRIPRKLLQGESVVVSPGTLVDIGDDNILQILPVQRVGETGRQQ